MRREKAQQELDRVNSQISRLQEKAKELERIIREADKESAAAIMDEYHISVDELLTLVRKAETENKQILEKGGVDGSAQKKAEPAQVPGSDNAAGE